MSEEDNNKKHSFEVKYFDFTGRAEGIRILLHIANVDYKDTRFKGTEWPTIKPTTPLGSVPVLKVDDIEYCQSVALMRYAAKLAGNDWYPTNPLLALAADEVADSLNEIFSVLPKKGRDANNDDAKFKELREEFQAGQLTKMATLIESRIQANGGVYIAGKPSYADLYLEQSIGMVQIGYLDHIDTKFFEKFPGIMASVKAIHNNEQIKAYKEATTAKK